MPLNTLSLHRPLTSYAKVQALVGRLIRNRRFQLDRPRVRQLRYLDIGCGPNAHPQLINLDFLWHPAVDLCWDIRRGLPFRDGSLQGVFSEHCLEHFSLPAVEALLCEIRRVLAPGATVRLVVPDGELYLTTYVRQLQGEASPPFPYQETEQQEALWTPIMSVNRVFYQDRDSAFGHRIIYDFQLFKVLLEKHGFAAIQRCRFGEGRDLQLVVDAPSRRCESLYVEASVPA